MPEEFEEQGTVDPLDTSQEDLVSPFLKNVAPADRPYVEKYLHDWNAGVTRRFQAIHDRYRPYKDIGMEAEDLRRASQFYQQLQNDPVQLFNDYQQALIQRGLIPDPSTPQEEPPSYTGDPMYEGLNETFVNKFGQMEQLLSTVAQYILGAQEQTQYDQEQQELDAVLNDLRQKTGDFDEDYVVAKIAQGASPEQAVQMYRDFVKQITDSSGLVPRRPAPPVLGGGGSIPSPGNKPTKDMTSTEVRQLVANMMAAAAQNNQ